MMVLAPVYSGSVAVSMCVFPTPCGATARRIVGRVTSVTRSPAMTSLRRTGNTRVSKQLRSKKKIRRIFNY